MGAGLFRIDVHHHFAPPAWLAEVGARERLNPRVKEWTPAKSVEDMDRAGVACSALSITNPGVSFGDAAGLARECNDYAAAMVRDFPRRFGLFAVMPMPSVDATLKEIEYALDVLKADGIGLFTSYGEKWLGDAAWTPVYEELDRRKAPVFVHPTVSPCCANLISELPPPVIEYGTDTTRAIASLMFTGVAARFPGIRFIFSHGGGTAPYLVERFLRLEKNTKDKAVKLPQGVLHELRKFHYDLALTCNPVPVSALLKLVPVSQVLFGTDYPSSGASLEIVDGLAACGLGAEELRAIERENAVRLMPGFGL